MADNETPIWRTGFVFEDVHHQAYLVATWSGDVWLFRWHPDGHWTSLRKLTLSDQLTFRKQQEACGWGDEERDAYADAHENRVTSPG